MGVKLIDLTELQRLAEEATPGPWEAWSDGPGRPRKRVGVTMPCEPVEDCGYLSHCIALTQSDHPRLNADANGQYIAAMSPDTASKLIAVALAAQAIAMCKSADPNRGRSNEGRWTAINAPASEFEALRTALEELK